MNRTTAALTVLAIAAAGGATLRNESQPSASANPNTLPTPPTRTARVVPIARKVDPLDSIRMQVRRWLDSDTGDEVTQERLTCAALALLTDENVADIVRALSSEEQGTPFADLAFERWLASDPLDAAQWEASRAEAFGISPERVAFVASAWLREPGLCAKITVDPESSWRQAVVRAAALKALPDDPATALALARSLATASDRTETLQTIAYDQAGRDPKRALDWITAEPDGGTREALLAVGAKAIALTEPDLAAGWLVAAVKSETTLTETAHCIVETWAAKSPVNAAGWVERFPPGSAREAAAAAVLRQWLSTDAPRAEAWLAGLPDRAAIIVLLTPEPASPDPQ